MTCLPYFTTIVRFREIREKIRRRSTARNYYRFVSRWAHFGFFYLSLVA